MSSVTARINVVKQPRGGYIKPSDLSEIRTVDEFDLNEEENVHSSIVGMAVDYLTRFMTGKDIVDAFEISMMGAFTAEDVFKKKGSVKTAEKFLKGIKGYDDTSIINACKLVSFDVWFRNPINAMTCKDYTEINPDKATIENIRIMVKRGIAFFDKYGPVVKDGFTFEKKGYTSTVDSGDGDFLTKDTLWDFKVTKSKPTNKHTLQLLMYYIMGKHSGQSIYKSITKIGIFNPRLNSVYLLEMSKVPDSVIKEVEDTVICY